MDTFKSLHLSFPGHIILTDASSLGYVGCAHCFNIRELIFCFTCLGVSIMVWIPQCTSPVVVSLWRQWLLPPHCCVSCSRLGLDRSWPCENSCCKRCLTSGSIRQLTVKFYISKYCYIRGYGQSSIFSFHTTESLSIAVNPTLKKDSYFLARPPNQRRHGR